MKSTGIYYNPQLNKIIEIIGTFNVNICGVDIIVYDVNETQKTIWVDHAEYTYCLGPILGLTNEGLKGYYKIGIL